MSRSTSTSIGPPVRELDVDNQENHVRSVKIQVGSYASTNVKKQSMVESANPKDASLVSASTSSGKLTPSLISTTTLYDLCDSSYNLKYCKKERKKKEVLSAEDKLAAETRSKNAILENTRNGASSSSSFKNERAKEQCGMGPRVEIVNGKIIVRESSLVVSQDSNFADGEYEEVVEGNHATATYSSFLKMRHSFSWGIEETRLFYQCLRQCGTEFSIMQSFFPGRTRKQLRAKFFREEKQHPELVKIALSTTLPLEIIPFEPSPTVVAALGPSSLPSAVNQPSSPSHCDGRSEEGGSSTSGSRAWKRSASTAGLSDASNCARSTEVRRAVVAAVPVHIELISDDEEALYNV